MEINDKVGEVELAYNPKLSKRSRLQTSIDCNQFFLSKFKEGAIQHHEEFKVAFLNPGLQVLGWTTVSSGGLTNTLVDVRMVLQYALLLNATMIVCCHNHPSGNVSPSRDDDNLTKKLSNACNVLNIKLLDHLIICPDTYFSYNDEGRL